MVCSMLAIERRDHAGAFGQLDGMTVAQFSHSLKPGVDRLVENWKERGRFSHLLRYEDLVESPQNALTGVFDRFGLDSDRSLVSSLVDQALRRSPERQAEHITAGSALRSIGRWERELSAEGKAACNDAFGDALAAFGYAPGAETVMA
jgi:hypothetical protein